VDPATDDELNRFERVLTNLGLRHGLSNFRLGRPGELIADISWGRTYLDVARFELDAEAVIQARVSVLLSGTELAARSDRGPLVGNAA
jgi:hypothetical protein